MGFLKRIFKRYYLGIVVIYSIWLTLKIITWITIFPLNEFILRTDITYNIVKNILINNDIDPETFSLPYTLISGIKFSLLFSLFLFPIILVLLRNNYYYYQDFFLEIKPKIEEESKITSNIGSFNAYFAGGLPWRYYIFCFFAFFLTFIFVYWDLIQIPGFNIFILFDLLLDSFYLCFLFLLLLSIISISFLIRQLSKTKIKINILHPDKYGGLKAFGNIIIRNLIYFSLIWAPQLIFYLIEVASNMIIDSIESNIIFFSLYFFFFSLYLLFIFLFLLMFPVWELRKKFIEVKKNEREKILNRLNDSYEKFFQENGGDLSYHLLICMNISDKIEKMRTWPWDMRIVVTIIGSIIIPIISILLTIIT